MAQTLQTKNFQTTITDVNTESRIVSGYASTWGDVSGADAAGDKISRGAFRKILSENGVDSPNPRIFHLHQHDVTAVLGRPTVLREDERGLYFETKIANTRLGDDVLQLYKEGVVNEHSIGFYVVKQVKIAAHSILNQYHTGYRQFTGSLYGSDFDISKVYTITGLIGKYMPYKASIDLKADTISAEFFELLSDSDDASDILSKVTNYKDSDYTTLADPGTTSRPRSGRGGGRN